MSPSPTRSIELFDSRGKFVMPSAEAIAALDKATQKRFDAVRTAALAAETASTATKEATEHVATCVAAVRDAEEHLRVTRPPVSAIEAARAWIKSQR